MFHKTTNHQSQKVQKSYCRRKWCQFPSKSLCLTELSENAYACVQIINTNTKQIKKTKMKILAIFIMLLSVNCAFSFLSFIKNKFFTKSENEKLNKKCYYFDRFCLLRQEECLRECQNQQTIGKKKENLKRNINLSNYSLFQD